MRLTRLRVLITNAAKKSILRNGTGSFLYNLVFKILLATVKCICLYLWGGRWLLANIFSVAGPGNLFPNSAFRRCIKRRRRSVGATVVIQKCYKWKVPLISDQTQDYHISPDPAVWIKILDYRFPPPAEYEVLRGAVSVGHGGNTYCHHRP